MSSVVIDAVVSQEEFTKLEKDLGSLYQAATQTEAMALKANLAASVAAHRLGVLANRLQPMVEATEGWGAYLKRHGMANRTVQRAQRIARVMDEEAAAKLTLTEADEDAAALEAVERGNVSTVEEWRQLKDKLRKAREALDKQESEREKALTNFEKELEADQQHQYEERATELDIAAKKAREQVEAEAKAKAKENEAALTANEMADALAAEEKGKASIPEPRAQGDTMPPEVAAELAPKDGDEVSDADEEIVADLLDDQQIDGLAERLHEIVLTRRNEVTDARTDPQVQTAVDKLLIACNGDAEIAYAVMAVWFSNNGL